MPEKTLKTVSLFSGGMGLDLGLESTGRFELVCCVENDRASCETIRLNKEAGRLPHGLQVIEADVSKLDPIEVLEKVGLDVGEVDIVVGGPPCQTFSTAGKRAGVQDHRGTLLWHFLRFVAEIKPDYFLMENVRGLLSAALKHRPIAERPDKGGRPLEDEEQPGSVIEQFVKDLCDRTSDQYRLDCFEVNAVNYGAPQLRERAILVGNRFGKVLDFPNPTHGPAVNQTSQRSLFPVECESQRWSTLGDAIGNLYDPNPEVLDFSPRKKSFLKLVPEGGNWRSLPIEVQQKSMGKAWHAKGGRSGWWRRLSMHYPCPTLITMPNHASTSLCHPTELRALSVREYAAIQEFPEQWVFAGKTAEKYRQIGNAVPVRLGKVAGEVIASDVDSSLIADHVTAASPQPCRIVYIQSHVRTRSWFRDGAAVSNSSSKAEADYGAPKTVRRKPKVLGGGK